MYFSWGNTEGHADGAGYDFSAAVYGLTEGAALDTNIPISQDAARANIGSPWRMPTIEDFNELVSNCTVTSVTIDEVSGTLFTSNINGKSIFFPATGVGDGLNIINRGIGYYWSASHVDETQAHRMSASGTSVNTEQNGLRRDGMVIRPVAIL